MSSDFLEIARQTLAELGYECAKSAESAESPCAKSAESPLTALTALTAHTDYRDFVPPAEVHEAITAACDRLPITPAQFLALCAPEDLAELAGGEISPESLRAFAVSFAGGIASGRIRFDGDWLVHHGAERARC